MIFHELSTIIKHILFFRIKNTIKTRFQFDKITFAS